MLSCSLCCLCTVKYSSISLTLSCFFSNSLCALHSRNSQQGMERGEYRGWVLGELFITSECFQVP